MKKKMYKKYKTNSDDNLPVKTLERYVIILIRSVYYEVKNYYPPVFFKMIACIN